MVNLKTKAVDFPPEIGNPRNSEGAFITLKDGSILFVYSYYDGENFDDNAHACLASSYSQDNGATWSDSIIILRPEDDNAVNIMSVSLIRMNNDDIGMFYIIKRCLDVKLYMRRSSDEGETWGDASCCMPSAGFFVVNNDRVIRLSSGRIVIPAALHRIRGKDINDCDERGTIFFHYSDDDGVTWKESDNFLNIDAPHSEHGLQEPGVIELKNGTLWAWCRTDLGRQYETFSYNSGETWTTPVPSIFTSPCSPLSMKRIPDNDYLLAVWNPNPFRVSANWTHINMVRTPLVAATSEDDGKTWNDYFVIDDDEYSGYCYTAIHFINDGVLLAYCAGGIEDGCILSRLRIRKIAYSEFIH